MVVEMGCSQNRECGKIKVEDDKAAPLPKYPLGKLVCIDVPRSVGPPLSMLRGVKATIKGSRFTQEDGRVYSVIVNNYVSADDIQSVEIKEEWLSKAGMVAESQEVKYVTIFETLKACSVYKIPTFQRRYCWALFQWKKLWQSIEKVRDNSQLNNHSLGRLMLLRLGDKSRLVLDGQQRLTTVTLLLSALCDRLRALGDDETANEYQEFCQEGRFLPTMYDRPDFRRCLTEPCPSGDSSIIQAKRFFTSQCSMLDDTACEEMLDAVLNRLSMTTFVVDDNAGMQAIFEKMSLRTQMTEDVQKHMGDLYSCIDCYASEDGGKETKSTHFGPDGERLCEQCAALKPGSVAMTPGIPMSPVDVIRNFVFDHYNGEEAMKHAFELYWGPIETQSGSDTKNMESSLAAYLDQKGFAVQSRWGLYKAFQDWWGTPCGAGDSHADAKLKELVGAIELANHAVAI